MNTILDFNRAGLADQPLNTQINTLIERAELACENFRQYLGASAIGSYCLRRIQFDWMCDAQFPARQRDIFDRGHWGEGVMRRRLIAAGFVFAPANELEFTALDGLFRGHADGKLIAGPPVPTLRYPCLWECKTLNAKGWRAVERDGLAGLYASYAGQVAIYQAYLNCTNPALFSVLNADDCQRLHFLVPFDATLGQEMSDKAVDIIRATRVGELLPRVTDNPDDWRCRLCGHRDRCWKLPA